MEEVAPPTPPCGPGTVSATAGGAVDGGAQEGACVPSVTPSTAAGAVDVLPMELMGMGGTKGGTKGFVIGAGVALSPGGPSAGDCSFSWMVCM